MSWSMVAVEAGCVYYGLGFALLAWVMDGFRGAFLKGYREDRFAAVFALVFCLTVWPYAVYLAAKDIWGRS